MACWKMAQALCRTMKARLNPDEMLIEKKLKSNQKWPVASVSE
jgi:hypothetical protein